MVWMTPRRKSPCNGSLSKLGDQFDPSRLVERPPRLRHHLMADVGQRDMALAALDQDDVEFGFEILQGDAQGRLADMAALGRTTERTLVGKGHQITQCRKLHRIHPIGERLCRCIGKNYQINH